MQLENIESENNRGYLILPFGVKLAPVIITAIYIK